MQTGFGRRSSFAIRICASAHLRVQRYNTHIIWYTDRSVVCSQVSDRIPPRPLSTPWLPPLRTYDIVRLLLGGVLGAQVDAVNQCVRPCAGVRASMHGRAISHFKRRLSLRVG